ncbi:MAG TPA: type II toxin-antitoxin system HigB family toxin [Verrucomicrobiae bacterium]
MRIIKQSTLLALAEKHPKSLTAIRSWLVVAKQAEWRGLNDVRRTYPHADLVEVGSGKKVMVFNICGNAYRLIVAVHFNTGMVYILRFLTHAEYSKDQWKEQL